jgi:hypothetical protein
MKTRTKIVTTMATLLCGVALCSTAATASAAPGTSFDSTRLPVQARTELRTSIDKARATDPAAFHEVREVFAKAHEADLHARGRKAPTSLRLAALGTKALLPMLELVAFDAPPLAPGEKAADRASVNRDLIEAIGLLRDARSMPVLVAVLARESDFATTRTAAEAIARMDSDEAASTLVASVGKASGERATAILAGMGSCHRAVVARTLSDRLAAHPDDAAARQVIKSLGHVGSAWAWKTLADRTDEAASRETAARALVAAYMQYTGEAREAAAKALLVVDDAHTDALIEAARRGASADVAVALDELARRFAANPTR